MSTWVGEAQRTDQLCPDCWLPAVWVCPYYYKLDHQDPVPFRLFRCGDCGWKNTEPA